jgi:hypothetical protein
MTVRKPGRGPVGAAATSSAGPRPVSKRKLRANRLGKPAGTGPTSAAGKARSAQNARKHGLNVQVFFDPNLCATVAAISEEIAPGCQDFKLNGLAHRIAEAQVDLQRVARARRDILSVAMADPDYRPPISLRERIALLGQAGDLVRRGEQVPPAMAEAIHRRPRGAEKLVAIMSEMSAKLARLDRYEREALARRKRAIRAFDRACRAAARRSRKIYKTN